MRARCVRDGRVRAVCEVCACFVRECVRDVCMVCVRACEVRGSCVRAHLEHKHVNLRCKPFFERLDNSLVSSFVLRWKNIKSRVLTMSPVVLFCLFPASR